MQIKQNKIILILGKKGFGKTSLAKSFLENIKHPIFIFDLIGEYQENKNNEIVINDIQTLQRVLKNSKNLNGFKILIQLDQTTYHLEAPEFFKLIFIYQKEINKNKNEKMRHCTVLIEEAWNFMTAHKIDDYFKSISLMGRHFGINSIVCSQRISNINRNFYSQADERYTFRQDDPHDVELMKKYKIEEDTLINLEIGEKIKF